MPKISIVLPAKNEAESLRDLLPELKRRCGEHEILVVDSGSSDDTARVCEEAGVRVVRQPYAYGNGAAVKAGARAASGEWLLFMDADGQHRPEDVDRLLAGIDQGYDMMIGARAPAAHATIGRRFANFIYNTLATWITGRRIPDLTSGFRLLRADIFRAFMHLLPNGFSYPTTITMALLRSGYSVGYVPIEVLPRRGDSHIRPLKDGVKFFLIIFRIGTLYSPLRIFAPVSLVLLLLGLGYYGYTYVTAHRFTNMSALLLTGAIVVLLIGLVSEQITSLYYATVNRHERS